MCFAIQALRKQCQLSSLPLAWDVYTGEKTCFTPSSSQIDFISWLLNSVPLSVMILQLPSNVQQALSLYAAQTVSDFLSRIRVATENLVNMSITAITVSMYLFQDDVTGAMGPTKSIQIISIGSSGTVKCLNSSSGCP